MHTVRLLLQASARLARQACDEAAFGRSDGACARSGTLASVPHRRLGVVAGSIGPASAPITAVTSESAATSDPSLSLRLAFREQVRALALGGADLILLETIYDVATAVAALQAVADHNREAAAAATSGSTSAPHVLPVIVSCTVFRPHGRLESGHTITEFVELIASRFGSLIFALGLNCGCGPGCSESALVELAVAAQVVGGLPVACYPNAGLPLPSGGYSVVEKDALVAALARWSLRGLLNIVGGCCGTTPADTALIAGACSEFQPRLAPALFHKLSV